MSNIRGRVADLGTASASRSSAASMPARIHLPDETAEKLLVVLLVGAGLVSPIRVSRMPAAIKELGRRRPGEVSDEEWTKMLESHIALQNSISMLILIGSIVGIIPLLSELKPNIPDIIRDAPSQTG